MFSAKFFRKLATNVRDKYRKHIFGKARDVHGRSFKGYSTQYAKRKRAGKIFRQDLTQTSTKAPIATGDLLNDFGSILDATKSGFTLGWASQGAKVKWLEKLGRDISTKDQPLPKGIINFITAKVSPELLKNLPKGKKTYRIGK